MSEYKYKNPLDGGFKQFKLTKKQHNELFPRRKRNWKIKYEYYYNDQKILFYEFVSILGLIFVTVLFPAHILIHGLANTKKIITEYKESFNQKKYGNFSIYSIYNESEMYKKVMETICDCESV